MLTMEQFTQLDQGDVDIGIDRTQDHVPVNLDVVGTKVTTLRQSCYTTLYTPGADPADRTRHRDAKAWRSRVAREAAVNGRNHARAQILGQSSCHACWPPLQHAW
jgi:hypothetical protein